LGDKKHFGRPKKKDSHFGRGGKIVRKQKKITACFTGLWSLIELLLSLRALIEPHVG
jgi:hypothetical protein